ncbi:hypothetical protein QQF64_020408 [Cirrhinus molitorella]|uniref:PiggyBac transposable element-derived protein domain-containing protein n=1 Tax=Cirrhinus molitorella TaxID=172907 RepID=A0ABR3L9D5_9TELE
METLIKNYKAKDMGKKQKKREEKREREQEVLALFKKEGENLLKNIKQARNILKEADRETKEKGGKFADPPPYVTAEGQFPLLKGTVEVTGEMQMQGNVELGDEKQMGPDVRPKCRQKRFSLQRALELLELIDGDNSDLDVSDNDDPILDGNYQPSPQEESSSEDSSDDEDPIPEPIDHSRGRRHADSADNGAGTGSGSGSGSSRTLRRRRQSQEIEADSSEDDLEESTPRPRQTKKKGDSEQGCGLRWKATPLTPNLAEYQHLDETDLDRHGWTPLDYFEQYIDRDLMMLIAECSNIMSLSKSGEPLNMTTDEIYHFFGAYILMSCIRYPTIRMYWSRALKITAITDKFTLARFFKLRGAIKVVIDHDVPEDLRMSDKFWKVRPFLDRILQGCLSLNRPDCASIDEQMIPFTGACPYRQYLPMKPNPVGIKNFFVLQQMALCLTLSCIKAQVH